MSERNPLMDSPPKRPLNAYFRFQSDPKVNRKILEDYPGLSGQDYRVKLGQIWRHMTDKEKEPYLKAYEKEKEQYDLENQEYLEAIGQIGEDRRKRSSKRKYYVHQPKHAHE